MRKRTRSTSDTVAKVKKQCFTHTAQRKFAANVPLGSVSKEASQASQVPTRKTEDFIDFLCFRTAPYLTPGLEVFAEPSSTPTLDDEIFENEMEGNDDDDDNDVTEEMSVTNEEQVEIQIDENLKPPLVTQPSTPPIVLPTEPPKKEDEEILVKRKKINLTNIDSLQPSLNVFKDIFRVLEYAAKRQQSLFLLTPPTDWKTLSYIQDELTFIVRTRHIHRLKLPVCDNFVTLHCIKKQLEKDCVNMKEIPLMALCEIDLAHLMEVVDMFGGVESVNSDQNWKALADQLCIPKNASRRVSRLEDIYLKYILPYALQSDTVKGKIKQSVLQEIGKLKNIPKENVSSKSVSLETFHRMACNGQYLYWKSDASYKETEDQLWKLVNEGSRHVTAVCGELDLDKNPQSYQNPKCKVAWKHSTLYSQGTSALRFIGKVSEISVPKLIVESTFWVSDWTRQSHGFHTLSYLHSGAEKIWYVVPKHSAGVFERLNAKAKSENSFLPPDQLGLSGCGVLRCVQREGQYVVVEPGCHYCTVSTGYSLSEVVCLAPLDWFSSDSFKEHVFTLDDFVVVKALLNYTMEEVKIRATDNSSSLENNQVDLLIEKLEQLQILVTESLEKLSKKRIENINYLKTKPNEPERCTTCDCYCYLFASRLKDAEDVLLCIKDVIKMVESKRIKASDVTVSALVSSSKINQLILKLKPTSPKKKKII